MAVLDYSAPSHAANSIASHFSGDRGAAVVLDVACGTGLVAKQVNSRDKKTKKKLLTYTLDAVIHNLIFKNSLFSVFLRITRVTKNIPFCKI